MPVVDSGVRAALASSSGQARGLRSERCHPKLRPSDVLADQAALAAP